MKKTIFIIYKKLKIVQLVDSLDLGGTERMSVNIANSLADNGIESHLFVTRNLGGLVEFVSPAVNLMSFGKKSTFDLITFFKLLVKLRKLNPNVLHVHQTSIYWAILLKPLLRNTYLIWHDHFGQSEMLNQYPRKEMNYIIPFLSAVITVNNKIKDFWIKTCPGKSNRIYFLRNFPKLKEIKRDYSKRSEVSIVNVANFRKQKDQITLILALRELKSLGFQFKTYLIGEIVDQNWLDEIKAMILTHNLLDEVEIVGPVNDVIPYLESATMGVLSSESEGLPVALLEYGMASLPTIATRVGQCESVLGFGEFGWLVPPKAPMDMALAMKEIIENPTKAKDLGQLLNSNVVENYGVKNFMDQYLKIVSEISCSQNMEVS